MTFQQLAASGPSQEAAQEAGAVGDQLRVLATTTEVELEGLSTGALATVDARENAEATRQTDVTALNHSIDRLATTVGEQVGVRLTVRNRGGETVTGVQPVLQVDGASTGGASYVNGPAPASVDSRVPRRAESAGG